LLRAKDTASFCTSSSAGSSSQRLCSWPTWSTIEQSQPRPDVPRKRTRDERPRSLSPGVRSERTERERVRLLAVERDYGIAPFAHEAEADRVRAVPSGRRAEESDSARKPAADVLRGDTGRTGLPAIGAVLEEPAVPRRANPTNVLSRGRRNRNPQHRSGNRDEQQTLHSLALSADQGTAVSRRPSGPSSRRRSRSRRRPRARLVPRR
jgi:hypothetical protein